MTNTSIERLTHLITVLNNTGRASLNMESWLESDPKTGKTLCRTPACAAGHAALDPTFNKLGLHIAPAAWGLAPTYQDNAGFTALEAFFALSAAQTEWIFWQEKYREAYGTDLNKVPLETVIEHINDVISEVKNASC